MERPALFNPKIEAIDREQLETLQLERLKWQVQRCFDNSPFYRERFQKSGIVPDDIRSIEDFIKVPAITKQELREEQLEHPPFGRYVVAPKESWRELHPSTGTTGVPVNTIWSEQDVTNITDTTARTMWCFGARPSDIVQNAFSYGLWIAGMAVHYASKRLGCFCIPIGATTTQRQIDYLVTARSTVLTATPSFALHIVENLKARGISAEDLALRVGCFGGEAGAEVDSTRRKIEEGLGIDAFDYFGLGEIGPTMASECWAKAGLHWTEDHHLIEIIDPQTMKRCSPGEVGVLVMTHLTREATPLLRYWTNDYASLDVQKCQCGRTHARSVGGILGRADDMIIYRGAKFYPIQVEKVVRNHESLGNEFKIEFSKDEVTGEDRCIVVAEYLEGCGALDGLAKTVKLRLREELQVTPELRLVKFGTLERTTFKAKRVDDLRRNQG